ncbi:hypothetical protein [Microcoleus sp. FACHB-672]|nr:hypothetical protein [Microcoleus sp. FACHB-672]
MPIRTNYNLLAEALSESRLKQVGEKGTLAAVAKAGNYGQV